MPAAAASTKRETIAEMAALLLRLEGEEIEVVPNTKEGKQGVLSDQDLDILPDRSPAVFTDRGSGWSSKASHHPSAGAAEATSSTTTQELEVESETAMDEYWSRAAWLCTAYFCNSNCLMYLRTNTRRGSSPPWEYIYLLEPIARTWRLTKIRGSHTRTSSDSAKYCTNTEHLDAQYLSQYLFWKAPTFLTLRSTTLEFGIHPPISDYVN